MPKPFDIDAIRNDFPILHQKVNGKPLVYLDNAATTQKPQAVIDALVHYYQCDNSNVHRGAHALADRSTQHFESARSSVQHFINAKESAEIIWTKGTTESLNIIAHSFLPRIADKGDKVIVSALEHHANFVPWQQQCQRLGLEFIVIPVTPTGELNYQALSEALDERVAVVAIAHVANSFGTVHNIESIINQAHDVGAKVVIDGAQAVAHFDVDVQALNCDFYAFSGHKLFAPTGTGVLYGKRELLEEMEVYQMGGEMIADVSIASTTFNVLPFRFEAGTPNIADVIGLKAAIDYLQSIDTKARHQHEQALMEHLTERARTASGINPIALDTQRSGVLSFTFDGMHCHDVAMLLDKQGIAVRTGHLCAMPIMKEFGHDSGILRASVAFYNTIDEIDAFFAGIEKSQRFLL